MLTGERLRGPVMAIAREAGECLLGFYDRVQQLDVDHKADASPVTEADLAAHHLIQTSLSRLTPQIPVLSEESDPAAFEQRHGWPCYWLIDPLDGTKEFLKANGEFSVNIALIDDHSPVLGVVHIPVTGTTYAGCARSGAIKQQGNKRPVAIRTRSTLPYRTGAALVSRSHLDERGQAILDALSQRQPLSLTPVGSSLKLCLIAEGLADLHLRTGATSEWDTAASQAVLEAAGGTVIDLDGKPLRYNRGESLINPEFIAQGDPQFDWLGLLKP